MTTTVERPSYKLGTLLLCTNTRGTSLRKGRVYEVCDNTDPETGKRSLLVALKERPGELFHPYRFKKASPT